MPSIFNNEEENLYKKEKKDELEGFGIEEEGAIDENNDDRMLSLDKKIDE
ncbi:MAG: hypothetical protein KKB21_05705 [Nanoarchaeota archaeon]|nr:hypothetical protein [Nanoarchaeota archaeon]